MPSIFSYQFFQNALGASLLTAVICGLVGAYIVVRRIVFVSGGITHASFGGIGLGLYLGINPILSAAGAAVLAAFSIGKLSRSEGIREDSAIASVWALGMALGVLFMTLTPGYATSLPSYLFGNILLVTSGDLIALGTLALVLVLLFVLGYRRILYIAFDADFARVRGLRVELWERLLLLLVAVSLVLTIRSVGIMLLLSLLTLPQTTVGLFTSDFRQIIFGSIILSALANVGGLLLSYYVLSVPSGVLIILLLFLFLALGKCLSALLRKRSLRR
ncbi:metal ABC transporter permease [Porphyromonas sp. oral taxon 278]|uniref:metal ABC transporter permease n=1 Tax=Porphyromonas sp. oral taxon 278 TaxID=712437 RepID=UPI0025F8FB88|nr:metal ABC transporter permease [Porphyromonas sp. oral taxon 278]